MKTLFEITDELGPTEVWRQLGESHSIISRAVRGLTDVSSALTAKCKATWGDSFDEQRTISEWYARRVAHLQRTAQAETTDVA